MHRQNPLIEVTKLKVIVLAAGYATRLYPLTLDRPKPLLEVGGKPMIEHILSRVDEIPYIRDIYVVTNNKFYQHFIDWRNTYKSRLNIRIINDGTMTNEDRLGAIGDIDFVVQKMGIDEDIAVLAGDNLFQFSLLPFFAFFRDKEASVFGCYDMKDKALLAKKLGVVELDKDGRVISFEEKPEHPKSALAASAMYIFKKDDVKEIRKCIEENGKPDNSGDFIKYLSQKKPVFGFVFEGLWIDIGSKEMLDKANRMLESANK
mgnify:CR=1 FL=1